VDHWVANIDTNAAFDPFQEYIERHRSAEQYCIVEEADGEFARRIDGDLLVSPKESPL
jgi:hypothetical protein